MCRSVLACSRRIRSNRRMRAPVVRTGTKAGMRRSPRSRWWRSSKGCVRAKLETRARARALQALYAWDMRPGQQLERVAAQIWDDLHVPPEERKRAAVLVRAVITEGADIDRALRDVTVNWRLERIGAIERSVLRLG